METIRLTNPPTREQLAGMEMNFRMNAKHPHGLPRPQSRTPEFYHHPRPFDYHSTQTPWIEIDLYRAYFTVLHKDGYVSGADYEWLRMQPKAVRDNLINQTRDRDQQFVGRDLCTMYCGWRVYNSMSEIVSYLIKAHGTASIYRIHSDKVIYEPDKTYANNSPHDKWAFTICQIGAIARKQGFDRLNYQSSKLSGSDPIILDQSELYSK